MYHDVVFTIISITCLIIKQVLATLLAE